MTEERNSIWQLDTALKELKIITASDLVRLENCLQSLAWKLELKTDRSFEEQLKLEMLQSMLKVSENYSQWESGQKINRGWNTRTTASIQKMTESTKKSKDISDTEKLY